MIQKYSILSIKSENLDHDPININWQDCLYIYLKFIIFCQITITRIFLKLCCHLYYYIHKIHLYCNLRMSFAAYIIPIYIVHTFILIMYFALIIYTSYMNRNALKIFDH